MKISDKQLLIVAAAAVAVYFIYNDGTALAIGAVVAGGVAAALLL